MFTNIIRAIVWETCEHKRFYLIMIRLGGHITKDVQRWPVSEN